MFEKEQFIEDCRTAIQESSKPQAVREVLAKAISEPGDVIRTLGEPEEAGLHTVYRSPELTILNVVWAPLMTLMPHNHNETWAEIGIYTGREDNIYWKRTENGIEAAGASSLSEKQVLSLGKNIIHSVINPIGRLTGALHIYGGDFFAEGRSEWDPETLTERPYDSERAQELFREANRRFFGDDARPL